MAPPQSVLSSTLHSITLTKIRELSKLRSKFEQRKAAVLSHAGSVSKEDIQTRIEILIDGVRDLLSDSGAGLGNLNIENIELCTEQSKYDASIPKSMLKGFEEELRETLDVQSRRLAMADLYSKMLQEWITPNANADKAADENGDDDFEHVEEGQKQRLQELCDKFEAVVFEPLETNAVEIDNYLRDLCQDDECEKALATLRHAIGAFGESFLQKTQPFDQATLKWCIQGLLAEDLLSDEKQSTLQEFLRNDVVLKEIADVLNMRFADIENWEWDEGEMGIPVMPRQGANGKYRIWMDEDVLQAILAHYIGIKWCVDVRSRLVNFVQAKGVWNWEDGERLSQAEVDRYQYYRGRIPNALSTVMQQRKDDYLDTFFLSQLPASTESHYAGGGYDDDNAESNWEEQKQQKEQKQSGNIKQQLLRKLAAEALIRQHLHGEAALVQSDLKWFATSISHTTVFAILEFIGVPKPWIAFYKKYLQPILNLAPASDEHTTRGPRQRLRGLPMAQAAEKLIGELVLFFMDFAVNRQTGSLLYRLHDDLWLIGSPSQVAEAWKTMGTYAKVMGLEFNTSKTGSAYLVTGGHTKDPAVASTLPKGDVVVGFLKFDSRTGDWMIDEAQVQAHVQQLGRQLSKCDSVLSWVQTWNSCIGRFFGNTFGEPAYCFGRKHVDSILSTHKEMQNELFPSSNLTFHLRDMIQTRFGISDLPDGFFYLPELLGGLGVRNPFVPLLLVRDDLNNYIDPHLQFRSFFAREKEAYEIAKRSFDEMTSKSKRKRLHDYKDAVSSSEAEVFFSLAEFTKAREAHSAALGDLYRRLQSVPEKTFVRSSSEVRRALADVGDYRVRKSEDVLWTANLHKNDVLRMCGDLRMVDEGFLPLGVLQMMRAKKVKWGIVL